jgi:hypothetical protein
MENTWIMLTVKDIAESCDARKRTSQTFLQSAYPPTTNEEKHAMERYEAAMSRKQLRKVVG